MLTEQDDRRHAPIVVREQVIRLAAPDVAPAATIARVVSESPDDAPSSGDGDTPSGGDYYSLWRTDEHGDAEGVDDASAMPPPNRMRRVLFGVGAAASVLIGVIVGAGALQKPTASMLPTGSIVIEGPPGAEVWVEGKLVGQTPLPEISAEVGSHEVVLRLPEMDEVRQTVTVDEGVPTVVTLGDQPAVTTEAPPS